MGIGCLDGFIYSHPIYASFLPAPGPGAIAYISSILRMMAALDFNGNPALLLISSIHWAVSSNRRPAVSIVTLPFN